MVATPKSGILETSSTTGTGAYTLAGATAGYRAWSTADNGLQFHYAVRTATQFEVGLGTYTHSSRQLTRDLIVANHSSNTSPVNWGVGTKEVASVLPPERVAMLDVENIWRSQQYFRGNTLWLDADDDTGFITTSDDQIRYMAGGVELYNLDFAGRQFRVVSDDTSGLGGPGLHLFRNSASPAVSDALGFVQFTGKDSAAATVTYGYIYTLIDAVTAGALSGRLSFQVASAGTTKTVVNMRPNALSTETGVSIFTSGKFTPNTNAVGVELNGTAGYVEAVTQDAACLYLNRKGSDGSLADWRRDNVSIGGLAVAGGVVTYGTFTGGHYADWAAGVSNGDQHEQQGTVVCSDGGFFAGAERLTLVRPSRAVGERSVYGVLSGPKMVIRFGEQERPTLIVHALGTAVVKCAGPISNGDLLRTSELPGVAQAQDDDVARSSTLGKATEDSPDDGTVRLVPAVLYAG